MMKIQCNKLIAVCVFACVAFRAGHADADDGATAHDEAAGALLDELQWLLAEDVLVTTASLHEETTAQAPATIRVITKRQIRERGYRSLHDLMKDLPGVDVLDHVQAEAKGRIAIRGVTGNNKFLILQDGIRINSPTGELIMPIHDNFPLYNVKQVEILYGPASAIYGADAFTGVINIITEKPVEGGVYNVQVEAGEFDTYRAEFYAAEKVNERVGISIGGHYHETQAPDLSDYYDSDFPVNDLVRFDQSVAVPAGERSDFTWAYSSFSTWAKVDVGDELTLGWNQSFFESQYSEGTIPDFASYEDSGETILMTGYAKYRYDIGSRASGNAQLSYSRYEQTPDSKFNNLFSGFADAYKYGLGERFQFEPQVSIDLDPHVLTAGLTLEHFHSIPHTTDLDEKYDDSKEPSDQDQFYPGTDGTLPVKFFETSYNNFGGFVQAQSRWTEKLSSVAGLRYDYNEDYEDTANPRLGLVYEASPETAWKALYGRSFLAPSPFQRYENFGTFAFKRPDGVYQSFFFRVPNPELEPEELDTIELSVSHNFSKVLRASLSTYLTKADNIVLPVFTVPGSDFIPGGFIEAGDSNQNVGELDAHGVDLTVDRTFNWHDSRLDLWSSISFVDGELEDTRTDTSVDLPFTSREMLKVGATYNLKDRFVITPSLRWNGDQRGYGSADDPDIDVPDFTVVDLYAEVRNRRQNKAVFLRVLNLFDERYYNGGPRNLGVSVFDFSPQDPRWVTAGLRVSL